jgi:tetratricopeptide (TPR) repeat protein
LSSVDEILSEIKSGLTGDVDLDTAFLIAKGLEHQDHIMSEKILREIGWMTVRLEPEDTADSFKKAFHTDRLGLEKALGRAERQIEGGNYLRAVNILENYISKINSSGIKLADDEENSYHHFRNMLEIAIYTTLYDEDCEFKIVPEDIGQLYTLYALALMRLKRVDESRKALNAARIINPVRTDVLFLLADLDRLTGRMEDYLETTKTCLKCVYTDADLAKCYVYLARYYASLENYELANALFFFSMSFDLESGEAQKELQNIQLLTGKRVVVPEGDEIKRLCQENGIPIGPSEDVLSFAYAIGEHLKNEGRYSKARFYYQVLLELTDSEEVREILESIPN